MEPLYNALRKNPHISAWKVNAVHCESCELFYVQKKVETNRATSTEDYNVTVYVDKDGKRGQSTFGVYAYMNEEEITALIEENVFAAGFTLNAYFDLPHPVDTKFPEAKTNLSDVPFNALIGKIGEAIMKANDVENASLSATEIFLYKKIRRVVNSNGVDVSATSYECQIETIPNFVNGKEEVELYQALSFGSFSPEELTKQVAEAIALVKDRAHAIPMPKVDELPVIIQDQEVEEVLWAIADDLDYGTAYHKSNVYEPGQNLQENREGDPLNITLVPFAPGALASRYVDNDGVVLKDVSIIADGVAKSRFGSYQYGFYLGEKNPTGVLPVLTLKSGSKSFAELTKKPYVRCVRFSGIQADMQSGFLGGEVRLGYYFDGEKEIPVTGFSIQADFGKAIASFLASKETMVRDTYAGPKYLFIPGVKIV